MQHHGEGAGRPAAWPMAVSTAFRPSPANSLVASLVSRPWRAKAPAPQPVAKISTFSRPGLGHHQKVLVLGTRTLLQPANRQTPRYCRHDVVDERF